MIEKFPFIDISVSFTVPFTDASNMCETDQITTKYPPILLNKYLENKTYPYPCIQSHMTWSEMFPKRLTFFNIIKNL